jgi:PAS domain S-box-containing protein
MQRSWEALVGRTGRARSAPRKPHSVDQDEELLHEELLHLAVAVGGIGVYETDFERGVTWFSPELCAILGLPAGAQMSVAQAARLFDERDRGAVQSSLEAASRSADRGKWHGVHRVQRADGAVRWVSIHGRRIYRDTADGPHAVRSIGTVVDITHLKETEAALRESELRLRLALDAAQMGTFEADMAASHAVIDAQEAHLLGLPADTRVVSSDELRKRVPLEDLQTSDAKQERLTRHHEAYHHEFRMLMADGTERWLSAYADVRSGRIFGVNFDVTARKRSEAALRESEARLRIAASGAALGVFEWDAAADHAVWENDRMYEIFGRSRAQGPLSKQQFVDEYLHADDVHDFEAAMREAMLTRGTFQAVCRIRRTDRSRRWLQIDGKFAAAAAGEPLRLVGVVADITKRKALERRARSLSERLVTMQEEERRAIAQELHDTTAQHLVAASLTMMRLKPENPSSPEEAGLWSDVEASIAETMKELRTFGYLMHPPALRTRRLCSSLQQYVDGFARRCGLDIKLRANRNIDKLPLGRQRSLFRFMQEALANVYRRASASHVSVDLRCIANRVHLVITDNGLGTTDAAEHERRAPLRPGVGERGIKARLAGLDGKPRVTPIKPRGTRLHAVLRVDDAHRKTSAGASRRLSKHASRGRNR